MKTWVAMFGLTILLSTQASADPVLNDPTGAWGKAKGVLDTLNPSGEWVYSIRKGEWYNGFAVDAFRIKSNDTHLGSARIGYLVDQAIYGSLSADLEGLYARFVPDSLKDNVVAGPALSLFSKYAVIGWAVGYSFDSTGSENGKFITGPVVGARVRIAW